MTASKASEPTPRTDAAELRTERIFRGRLMVVGLVSVIDMADLERDLTTVTARAAEAEAKVRDIERMVQQSIDDVAVNQADSLEAIRQRDAALARASAAELDAGRLREELESEKRHSDMIANAWQREICQQGMTFRNKSHWIDFMVLATRAVVDMAKENGVKCCRNPELCANTNCNRLLRYRFTPEYRETCAALRRSAP